MDKKNIERLLKDAKGILIVTNNGCGIEGRGAHLLSLYTMLTSQLSENLSKEQLQHAFDMAFYSNIELLEELKNVVENAMKEMDKD